MKYLMLLMLSSLLLFSCSSSIEKTSSSKTEAAPLVEQSGVRKLRDSKSETFNIENYNEVSDYEVNSKEHLKNFLDKYYDKLHYKNTFTKEEYLQNFRERAVRRTFLIWAMDSINNFKFKDMDEYNGKVFSFYFQNRGKEKTIFYIHGNVTPVLYWLDFATSFNEYFKDYNVVFVDSTKINWGNEGYTSDAINDIFTSDVNEFLALSKMDKSKNYFNIVCHTALWANKFLNKNPDKYEKVIYYAPMIHKNKDDAVQDLDLVFGSDLKKDDFYSVYYIYTMADVKRPRSFFVPKKFLSFNTETERNLTRDYFHGIDISKIKSKALIYPQNETMFVGESHNIKAFKPNQVTRLDGMAHHDYFSIKEKYPNYFEALKKLVEN